ncbi:hypothetical protein BH23CHL5_BH23CHL5_26420 [soil metagenome]
MSAVNDDSQMMGEIELVTFMGPITRFDVRLPGDDEPVMIDLVSDLANQFAIGQRVAVDVPPEAIRLYPVS